MPRRTRYELTLESAGGYTARRQQVDAAEPLGCDLRLEVDADMPRGRILALLPELVRLVAQTPAARVREPQQGP